MNHPLLVTPLYAGLLSLWYFALGLRVSSMRRQRRIFLGDGNDAELQRRIRGHGNFSEYVPLALLLMLILEATGFSIYVIHALGIVLLIARLLHGYALSFSEHFPFGRIAGAGITYALLAVEGVLCLYQGVIGHWLWCCAA